MYVFDPITAQELLLLETRAKALAEALGIAVAAPTEAAPAVVLRGESDSDA